MPHTRKEILQFGKETVERIFGHKKHKESKVLLEYSEQQKCFHYNWYDAEKKSFQHRIDKNGWRPICLIDEKYCTEKDEGFGELANRLIAESPDFGTVRTEILKFFATHD